MSFDVAITVDAVDTETIVEPLHSLCLHILVVASHALRDFEDRLVYFYPWVRIARQMMSASSCISMTSGLVSGWTASEFGGSVSPALRFLLEEGGGWAAAAVFAAVIGTGEYRRGWLKGWLSGRVEKD